MDSHLTSAHFKKHAVALLKEHCIMRWCILDVKGQRGENSSSGWEGEEVEVNWSCQLIRGGGERSVEKRVTTTFNGKWQKRHSLLTFEEGNNKTPLTQRLNLVCGEAKNPVFLEAPRMSFEVYCFSLVVSKSTKWIRNKEIHVFTVNKLIWEDGLSTYV